MSRSNPAKRLAKALPVVAVLVGTGLKAIRKHRASRRVRDGRVNDNLAPAPGLVPTPAAVDLTAEVLSSADPSGAKPEPRRRGADQAAAARDAASGPAAARRTTATTVLEVLATGGAMTAGEVAAATGLSRSAISSTLSRLTRTGEVSKAARGYQLASTAVNAPLVTNATARNARGQTKAAVLTALSATQALTSGDVAAATGLSRSVVSTTLSRLAKAGDVVKAERGYLLPG